MTLTDQSKRNRHEHDLMHEIFGGLTTSSVFRQNQLLNLSISSIYLVAVYSSACPWQRHSQSISKLDIREYRFQTLQMTVPRGIAFRGGDGRDMRD
jgi:hypothetical protein